MKHFHSMAAIRKSSDFSTNSDNELDITNITKWLQLQNDGIQYSNILLDIR